MSQVTSIQEQNARNNLENDVLMKDIWDKDVNLLYTKCMKDFLELYNKLTEQCFQRCVFTFPNKTLTTEETKCTDVCSERYIKFNQRMMMTYVEFQNAKQDEAIKEMEKAHAEGRQPNLPGFSTQVQQTAASVGTDTPTDTPSTGPS